MSSEYVLLEENHGYAQCWPRRGSHRQCLHPQAYPAFVTRESQGVPRVSLSTNKTWKHEELSYQEICSLCFINSNIAYSNSTVLVFDAMSQMSIISVNRYYAEHLTIVSILILPDLAMWKQSRFSYLVSSLPRHEPSIALTRCMFSFCLSTLPYGQVAGDTFAVAADVAQHWRCGEASALSNRPPVATI